MSPTISPGERYDLGGFLWVNASGRAALGCRFQEERVAAAEDYPRDLEEKHKILINRRTLARRTCMLAETYEGRQPTPAPVRSARISPRASGAPPSAIPSGSSQDGPAFGRVRHIGPPRR